MPPVVAAVAGIVSGVASAVVAIGGAVAGLGGLGGALFRMGIGMVVSSLLAPKPPRGAIARRNSTFAIRQPSPSRRIPYGVSRLGGIYFYAETYAPAGLTEKSMISLVLGIGDGPIEAVDKMYFDDEEVALTNLGNDSNGRPIYGATAASTYYPSGGVRLVTCQFYTGSAGQPADATLVANSASKWTASHTLDGIAYAVVTMLYDPEVFRMGVPNISFEVRGRNDVYDPRTSSSAYSNNPALCLNHYLTTAKTGPNATYASEVDETALTAAANVCDETVSLDAGGTEKRYTCNGFIDLAESPEGVISDFKTAMAGWMVYAGGKFKIYAGAYVTPTLTIDEDFLAGPVEVRNRMPKRERINLVKGVYQAPQTDYQPTDFPSVTNSGYVTEDGEEMSRDMELVFTTSPATAQRIAKIELERSRREITVGLLCNLKALPAEAGMTVNLTLDRFGYSAKPFFVQSSTIGLLDDGTVGLSLSLREIESACYSWTPASDEKAVANAPDLSVGPPQVGSLTVSPDASAAFAEGEFPIRPQITTNTTGAAIRYSYTAPILTEAGGEPYNNEPELRPSLTEGRTLYARAFKAGYEPSDSFEGTYISTSSPETYSGLHGRFRADIPEALNHFSRPGVSLWNNTGVFYNQLSDGRGGYDIVNAGSFQFSPSYNDSLQAVEFDGSNDRLWTRDGTRGGSTYYYGYRMPPLPMTMIVALTSPASWANFGTVICSIPVSGNSYVRIKAYYNYLQAARIDDYGSEATSSGSYIGYANTFYVAAARFTTSIGQMRVNKSSDTANTSSLSVSNQGPMGLGAQIPSATNTASHTDFWSGSIHEVMTFSSNLSDATIDTITDYLTDKYNPS
tara:strand:+ start:2156 stop:4711 length:2556 start_codon:yes stop_codon:yes gene_type:complete